MSNNTIFTIGHSLTSVDDFIETLKNNQIEVVVDVRTYPRSNRARQFNQDVFTDSLSKSGIKYLYKGSNLGGMGENVNFEETIFEISKMASSRIVVVMCSEGNPKKCHRYSILAPAFQKLGLTVEHLISEKNTPQIILL